MISRRSILSAFPVVMVLSLWVVAQSERGVELPGVAGSADIATAPEIATLSEIATPAEIVPPNAFAGRRVRVLPGDSLQTILDQAQSGDVIELPAGAVFTGPFVLPEHEGTDWVTIISVDTGNRLPPAGVRVTPAHVPAMATLVSQTGPVIRTARAAAWYHFIGVEIRPASVSDSAEASAYTQGPLVNLVELSSGDNNVADMPHHIVFERSYLHGDNLWGTRRGIVLNGAHIAVLDSHLSDFKSIEDAQAIAGWDGTGPFMIRNNFLAASGENLMFGGADPSVTGRVPSDILISANHFYKPLSWQSGHADYDGSNWAIKNLLELKNASRVLIDGNLFEHNWPQAQNGFAILFTVRNQDGQAPWSVVEDVVFSNNIVRRVGAGINVLGYDNNNSSQRTQGLRIKNNLFYEVGGEWGSGRLIQLLDSPSDITISRNTALQSAAFLWMEGNPVANIDISHNIFLHNNAGISGTNTAPGQDSIDGHFSGAVVIEGNIAIGPGVASYREGMSYMPGIGAMNFSAPATGDFRRTQLPVSAPVNEGVDFVLLCAALAVTERPLYC